MTNGMKLREGSELQNGKYRILRVLGQGGFGITYLAENTFFEKKVAIKEFFPKDFCGRDNTSHLTLGTQNNAETVAKLKDRFLKEAKNIAKLDHPGIVKIHDIFEENNTAYYVMDYIEGENLNEMVKRNGPLSEEKAVEYLRKVGDALEYIHSRNMTHFDVKPANIMVSCSDNQPILIDFGLSKQYDAHGDATSTLMQGFSHGYSPIELYNPGSISSFSPQTDVYSLGATLYYLLTGIVPPAASDILENGLSIPSSISGTNSSAIQNAMSVSRSNRQKSIDDFIQELSGLRYNNNSNPPSTLLQEQTMIIDSHPMNNNNSHCIQRTATNSYSDITKSNYKTKKKKGLIITIFIVFVCISFGIYAFLQQSENVYSERGYSKAYFTNNVEAKIGDYVYEDNTISHEKTNDKRIIGRIISTGYHPSVFSSIPIANCTKNEIEGYISSFSTTHRNVRIPSQNDWAEFFKTMYNYSVTEEYVDCDVAGAPACSPHSATNYYLWLPGIKPDTSTDKSVNIINQYSKNKKDYLREDGMSTKDAWCSEYGEVNTINGKSKYRLKWNMLFGCRVGQFGGDCSHNDNDRANLIVIYDL